MLTVSGASVTCPARLSHRCPCFHAHCPRALTSTRWWRTPSAPAVCACARASVQAAMEGLVTDDELPLRGCRRVAARVVRRDCMWICPRARTVLCLLRTLLQVGDVTLRRHPHSAAADTTRRLLDDGLPDLAFKSRGRGARSRRKGACAWDCNARLSWLGKTPRRSDRGRAAPSARRAGHPS
jgi:hypothetical protein